jgi:hypothetical protein
VKPLAVLAMLSGTGGGGDWALMLTIHGIEAGICATSSRTCDQARWAIAQGYWPIVPPQTPTYCVPHPYCFDER